MVKAVADYQCVCGEGPLYDPDRKCVFWTDIDSGRLFRLDHGTGSHRQIYTGDPVGGFTLQEDGSLLLFRVKDIVLLDPDTSKTTKLQDFADEGSSRFNDTQAGPTGICYAGTIGKTGTSGGLFRLDPEGKFELLFRGTGCSNGMGWSPDRQTMYWTCSTRKKIFAYDYDSKTGAMSNERPFVAATKPEEGTPDGMAVDSKGNVYSARWGGSGVYVYGPDGAFQRKIDIPAKQASSLCFGGPDLMDIYVTTAGRGDTTPGAGSLYHVRNDVAGQPVFRSKIPVR